MEDGKEYERSPEAATNLIKLYDNDLRFQESLRRELELLNRSVGSITTLPVFRPLTERGVTLKAGSIWKDAGGNPFVFTFEFQNYIYDWIGNNGIRWSKEEKSKATEDLAILLLNRFRLKGI